MVRTLIFRGMATALATWATRRRNTLVLGLGREGVPVLGEIAGVDVVVIVLIHAGALLGELSRVARIGGTDKAAGEGDEVRKVRVLIVVAVAALRGALNNRDAHGVRRVLDFRDEGGEKIRQDHVRERAGDGRLGEDVERVTGRRPQVCASTVSNRSAYPARLKTRTDRGINPFDARILVKSYLSRWVVPEFPATPQTLSRRASR